jgi:hypothetical protein
MEINLGEDFNTG